VEVARGPKTRKVIEGFLGFMGRARHIAQCTFRVGSALFGSARRFACESGRTSCSRSVTQRLMRLSAPVHTASGRSALRVPRVPSVSAGARAAHLIRDSAPRLGRFCLFCGRRTWRGTRCAGRAWKRRQHRHRAKRRVARRPPLPQQPLARGDHRSRQRQRRHRQRGGSRAHPGLSSPSCRRVTPRPGT
jgi:hypothetical protein